MQNLRALAASAFITVIVVLGAGSATGAASSPPPVAAAPTGADAWRWPLAEPHPVTRAFLAPASAYAAGHRGIDLAAAPQQPVLAPHDGVVSFAGPVVDRPVLSITQPGDVIVTVEPVDSVVAVGDRVRAGQIIGTVGSGGHCPPGCLHLGVRLHGSYVSPLLYLGKLPRAVLLPTVTP
ncbi:M23 family metallopeptidase [Cryobacterium sp. TMT1-3]|uniref:M23 family metallopeptidase n=1 Tax=Cryobacterium luteum TaxID=1424661 RepID=A0A1H8EUZ7_9MICO|nr:MULTISPECIES: M23 family metallopeptidase [Cryobacterium]TFB85417.1 M23 family metallopeptidase [Cryobacterium luteum]TFC26678.1 M23 family metallopeptidase [Cryobacterium sp. TMT1-3]SEN23303.1 Peptidase family M23 [Cryobacterium luteum]